jgi:hypothetical protein
MGSYSQQVNFLYANNDGRCPRQAFLDDLKQEIEQRVQEGDQVIVMLDAIGDVREGEVN